MKNEKSKKEKLIAIILAFFLGNFGIHRFYLKKPISGLLMILFFWTFIPALIAIIDVIRYAFMSNDKFDKLYN